MLLIFQIAVGVVLGIFISYIIKSNADYLKNNAERYIEYFLLACLVIGNVFYIETFVNLTPKWISFINNLNYSLSNALSDLVYIVLVITITGVFIYGWFGRLATYILNIEDEANSISLGKTFVYGLLNIDVMGLIHYEVLDVGIKYDLSDFWFGSETAWITVATIYVIALCYRKLKNRHNKKRANK